MTEGPTLAQFLVNRDAPCPHCGHHLRGSDASLCPECGAGLRLGVVCATVPSRWYRFGAIGAFTSATIPAIAAITAFARGYPFGGMISIACTIWFFTSAAGWLRARPVLSALPQHKQQEHAFVAWIGAIVFGIALAAFQALH